VIHRIRLPRPAQDLHSKVFQDARPLRRKAFLKFGDETINKYRQAERDRPPLRRTALCWPPAVSGRRMSSSIICALTAVGVADAATFKCGSVPRGMLNYHQRGDVQAQPRSARAKAVVPRWFLEPIIRKRRGHTRG